MVPNNQFSDEKTFLEKVKSFDFVLLVVILLLGIISCFAMYSTDGGQLKYHTNSHILKFSIFFVMFLIFSFLRIRTWYTLAYIFYALVLFMLVYVMLFVVLSDQAGGGG